MNEEKRLKRIFKFALPIAKLISKSFFNYSFQTLPDIEEPYLLLSNHNTDFDCLFLALAAQKQLYFVATENLLRMGLLGKIATFFFHPIIHYKGKQGLATARTILSHIKKGNSVAMFPEGNRSFNGLTCPIPQSSGKLAKTSGTALVTYRLEGGYFSTPRWGKGIRKGKITGKVMGIYTKETLQNMKATEITEQIRKDLYVDAYEDQKNNKKNFKGKTLAENLESTLFLCPQCKEIGSLHSKKDEISCSCGFLAKIDEFGYLNSKNSQLTITKLDENQKSFLKNLQKTSSDKLFSDEISLLEINENHKVIKEEKLKLEAFSNYLMLGNRKVPMDLIEGMAINQRNLLLINLQEETHHFECKGKDNFNALKYLYLYKAASGKENL